MKNLRIGTGIALVLGLVLAGFPWSLFNAGNGVLLLVVGVLIYAPAVSTLFIAPSPRALVRALATVGVVAVALLTVLVGSIPMATTNDDARLSMACVAVSFAFLLFVWPFAAYAAHRRERDADKAAEDLARVRHEQLLTALASRAEHEGEGSAWTAAETLARERHQVLLDAIATPRCWFGWRLKREQR